MESNLQNGFATNLELLVSILRDSLSEDKMARFLRIKEKADNGISERIWYVQFSAIAQKVGKSTITPGESTQKNIHHQLPILHYTTWTTDQIARLWLILKLGNQVDPADFFKRLQNLFQTADRGELVTLYKALSIFPYPEQWVPQAAEGVRTNITDVFDAIALDNPFPSQYFRCIHRILIQRRATSSSTS